MVTIRSLTPQDWPLWREARLAALTEAPHAFRARLSDWAHGGERQWRARLATAEACHLVALLDGRVVGLAGGVPGPDGTAQLRSVWVGPEVRGRGVGDRLVAAVEAWARRSGATTLTLAVLPGNDAALALYRRHGFVAADAPGLRPDGATGERVMAKPLG
ncbi:GNAT family N-acetyltransferase [Kitasatospora sp. NPDC127111]|uniref:GNAT family N-acetyltransferase n=1 Tax=Kitasatospora sp. NPDC127111 TaxID=3345363 RepID=UPI0036442C58